MCVYHLSFRCFKGVCRLGVLKMFVFRCFKGVGLDVLKVFVSLVFYFCLEGRQHGGSRNEGKVFGVEVTLLAYFVGLHISKARLTEM